MALKKSQLYSSLWQSCDELRGGMDASQYKDYVLTLLFMKYVTDKYAGDPDAVIEVPEGGSFHDMARLKGDKEIGDKINKIIARFAEANDLKGVVDQADFNDESKLGSGKEMQDRLSKLIAIFEGLDFRANRAEGDDLLGDAYEYLMRHFATESGKSKGQFYTPAEVSRIMAKVIGIERAAQIEKPTVYDPTCGSGSLLIKAADESNAPNIAIYGQEMDVATWALAKMNMILHGHPAADIRRGNTLSNPQFKDDTGRGLKRFDFAVANPPFSAKAWTNGLAPENDPHRRFEMGIPPEKNGDYAFLLHLIASLKSTGKGAIILPHGVLFRGYREADIRRKLVERGYIKGIIGLPPNLFYGTGIPACIVVIDKENAHTRSGIFMVDASKDYRKDGNKNRLRERDIHKIVDVFTKQIEIPGYSRMVPVAEIADPRNDYNLNIPRYIDSSEPEDIEDLGAHLWGGIPERDVDALADYWGVFPTVRKTLFQATGRPGYLEIRVAPERIKETLLGYAEVRAFRESVLGMFDAWREAHAPRLKAIKIDDAPKEIIRDISEDLLARFADLPLLDPYDIYQRLMDYWAEVMQDDVYLIAADGWTDAAKPRPVVEDKARNIKESPDLVVGKGRAAKKYKMDLIPPDLVIERYFAQEKARLERLEAQADAASRELEQYLEEQASAGEDGEDLLEEVRSDSGKVSASTVKARLKAIKGQSANDDERQALQRALELLEAEAVANKAVKKAREALGQKVLARYGTLTEAEIKTLVVEDKWFASLRAAIENEVERLIQRLVGRLKELDDRYARPLPELEREVEALGAKVEAHLKKMGLVF